MYSWAHDPLPLTHSLRSSSVTRSPSSAVERLLRVMLPPPPSPPPLLAKLLSCDAGWATHSGGKHSKQT